MFQGLCQWFNHTQTQLKRSGSMTSLHHGKQDMSAMARYGQKAACKRQSLHHICLSIDPIYGKFKVLPTTAPRIRRGWHISVGVTPCQPSDSLRSRDALIKRQRTGTMSVASHTLLSLLYNLRSCLRNCPAHAAKVLVLLYI